MTSSEPNEPITSVTCPFCATSLEARIEGTVTSPPTSTKVTCTRCLAVLDFWLDRPGLDLVLHSDVLSPPSSDDWQHCLIAGTQCYWDSDCMCTCNCVCTTCRPSIAEYLDELERAQAYLLRQPVASTTSVSRAVAYTVTQVIEQVRARLPRPEARLVVSMVEQLFDPTGTYVVDEAPFDPHLESAVPSPPTADLHNH